MMDIDIDEEIYQRVDGLEAEKHCLLQQIKQLESALDKEKKFHRKFVEDVLQSEEIRNQDFEKEKKELVKDKKRLTAENRQLTKDKLFYQSGFESLVEEKEDKTSSSPKNLSKSSPVSRETYNTRLSTTKLESSSTSPQCSTTKGPAKIRQSTSKAISKLSAKIFEDNKRLKLKVTKVTRDNASLRLKLKQLENLNDKMRTKNLQHDADQNELQNLFESTRRTNGQVYTPYILSKLGELSRD